MYNQTLSSVETSFNKMQETVMLMNNKREQLDLLLKGLPEENKYKSLKTTGAELVQKMKVWDEEMVQRKSKAYDDVENFPNKFTANYLFLINQMQNDLPVVTQPSLDMVKEMNIKWGQLKSKASTILEIDIPAMIKLCWDAGIGAVWKN